MRYQCRKHSIHHNDPLGARMTQAPTTPAQVAEAAAAIEKDGQIPSIRRVIARLGGGSPNYIGPLLKDWKVSRQASDSSPIALDQGVSDAIVHQIRSAVSHAVAEAHAQLREAEDNAALLARSCCRLEDQLRERQLALDAANGRLQQQQGQLDARECELEALRVDSAAAIAEYRASAAAERGTAEDLREQHVLATVRLEALPHLEKALEEREQCLHAANADVARAHEDAAVATALSEAQKQRAMEAADREGTLRKELGGLQVELAKAWQGERSLRIEVQHLVSQAATAEGRCAALEAQLARLNRRADGEDVPPKVDSRLAA
jgi:chromosome segregation ATPase